MEQVGFDFDAIRTYARKSDPLTSQLASARANSRPNRSERYQRIYDWLKAQGNNGGTMHEIGDGIKEDPVAVARCMAPMARMEPVPAVKKSDRTRLSPSGNPCTVWVAVVPGEPASES